MRLFILFLISTTSFNAAANEGYDAKNIIGKWLCIDDGPNFLEVTNTEYEKTTFRSFSHAVVMKNTTGAIIEINFQSNGSWRLIGNTLQHQVDKITMEALNKESEQYAIPQNDSPEDKIVEFKIYKLENNAISYWTDTDGLVFCIRK